jgi:hypothetical protein
MIIDPGWIFDLHQSLWPDVRFYDKQLEVIESSFTCPETYVVAGNQLGKDFVAAFVVLAAFLMCLGFKITCRIVTTSVAEHHLRVLWGEISRFIVTARRPLLYEGVHNPGGVLVLNYQELRRTEERAAKNPLNYLVGRVSQKGEGLAGHHAAFTMFVGDEASGLDNEAYKAAQGWAKHMLIFGNPNPCRNFFYDAVKGGDILAT